ncbi:MAG: hypothetical protein Q8O55_01395 [Dehalococcoidales bacterium]|nr:hypothetical protein [Dehalococcoidales bacterium]
MGQLMKSNGSLTVKSLRRAVGIPGHRPSGKNACVGAALRGKSYAQPPPGLGGRNNVAVRQAFYDAAKSCGFNIKKKRPT